MNKWSVKIKSVHNEIFIFDSSKMLKSKNIHFKDIYSCSIEIIKGLTDKGQFQYLAKLKGPQ